MSITIIYCFIVFAFAFLSHAIFIELLKKANLKYGWLNSGGIPVIGGLSMGLSFIAVCALTFLICGGRLSEAMHIVIASVSMLVFGAIDDWRELSILAKFIMQVIATCLLIYFGIRTRIVNIGNIANIIITFIWVIGITNAFNHLDIMDGLAAGTAAVVSLALFIISVLNGDISSATLSLILLAVNASYLIYNFPPAQVYMGNTGSHFLGFLLAGIAIAISYAPVERKVGLLSPLLILGLPIFDTVFLILARAGKGKLPFCKTDDHLALRLMEMGYSKKATLFYMLLMNVFFCIAGIALSRSPNVIGLGIILGVVIVSLRITGKINRALNG